jgi:hypothetical protein
MRLAEAVVDAGAVRFRPMLLIALAVAVGASVILFDPIFSGTRYLFNGWWKSRRTVPDLPFLKARGDGSFCEAQIVLRHSEHGSAKRRRKHDTSANRWEILANACAASFSGIDRLKLDHKRALR